MKVLYLTTMYPTPAFPQKGIFCHEQVKALKKIGVDVDVVVPIPIYDKEVKQKYWDYEGVSIEYIRFFKLPGTMDFHKTGFSLYWALKRSIGKKIYDIYHADAALPSGYAAMLLSKENGIPFVVHGHGLDVFLDVSYEGHKNRSKIVTACKKVYEETDAVIGVSKKVIEKIQSRVDVADKAYVVYNGVDTNKFKPTENIHENFVITAVGNLIPLKGHEYTIKAVKSLIEKGYKDISLNLIGSGEQEEYLRDLVEKLGLTNVVEMLGYIPYDQVAEYLQKSDMFILPSYYEALGCVYLESMACGLTTVGCKNNGIDEIISNGITGFLVDGKNVEQIIEVVENVYRNPTSLGDAARNLVSEKYQWKHSAEKLDQIYHTIKEKIYKI